MTHIYSVGKDRHAFQTYKRIWLYFLWPVDLYHTYLRNISKSKQPNVCRKKMYSFSPSRCKKKVSIFFTVAYTSDYFYSTRTSFTAVFHSPVYSTACANSENQSCHEFVSGWDKLLFCVVALLQGLLLKFGQMSNEIVTNTRSELVYSLVYSVYNKMFQHQ